MYMRASADESTRGARGAAGSPPLARRGNTAHTHAQAHDISEKTSRMRPPPLVSSGGRRDAKHILGVVAGGDEPRDESDEGRELRAQAKGAGW